MIYYQIANLAVPSAWIAVVLAFVITALAIRHYTGRKTDDWYWNVFFLYIFSWKFSYIFIEFPLFIQTPMSALYYNGGIFGHIFGMLSAVFYIYAYSKKNDFSLNHILFPILTVLFISFETFYRLFEKQVIPSLLQLVLFAGAARLLTKQKKDEKKMHQTTLILFLAEFLVKSLSGNLLSLSTYTFFLLGIAFFILFTDKEKLAAVSSAKPFRNQVLLWTVFTLAFHFWNPITPYINEDIKIPAATSTAVAKEGHPAPDFELTTLTGETIHLSDYKGKKVVLNFWASWCPPCRSEMPHIQKFHEKYGGSDTIVIAVNLTSKDHGMEKVTGFVEDFGLTFPIPLDENGQVGATYHTVTIPASYFINPDGIIVEKISGPMDLAMMQNIINRMD